MGMDRIRKNHKLSKDIQDIVVKKGKTAEGMMR